MENIEYEKVIKTSSSLKTAAILSVVLAVLTFINIFISLYWSNAVFVRCCIAIVCLDVIAVALFCKNFYWIIGSLSFQWIAGLVFFLIGYSGSSDIIFLLISFVSIAFLVTMMLLKMKRGAIWVNKLYYVPALILLLCGVVQAILYIIEIIMYIEYANDYELMVLLMPFYGPIWNIFLALIILMIGITLKEEVKESEEQNTMYISMGKHIVLLLFTLGIWEFVWIYRVSKWIKINKDESWNPTTKLLLCIFVPFYTIYWVYKTSTLVDGMAQEKNIPSSITTTCLVLAIFVPIVAPMIMQDKINAVCDNKQPLNMVKQEQKVSSIAEDLRQFKALLDEGVITEEEYQAKKQSILNK